MSIRIKTPTETVMIEMRDTNGICGARDYIGNHQNGELKRSDSDAYDYEASVADAMWWVRQCRRQMQADAALTGLSDEDREAVLGHVNGVEFADLPDAIMAACDEV